MLKAFEYDDNVPVCLGLMLIALLVPYFTVYVQLASAAAIVAATATSAAASAAAAASATTTAAAAVQP